MDFVQSKIKEALNYDKEGKIDSALEIYNNLLKKNKNNFNLLYLIGVSYTKQKRFKLAADFFEKATKVNSESFAALNNLGAVLMELKKFEEAIKIFKKIKKEQASDHFLLNNIAICYSSLKDYDNAKNIYLRIIEENPKDYVVINNLGNIFFENKKYKEAIEYFNKTIEIKKDYFIAYNNLGTAYQELGQADKAIDNYLKAIKINPNYYPSIKNIGDVYKNINKKKEALDNYRLVKELKPDFVGIDMLIFELEMSLCSWGNYDENLKIVKEIVKNKLHIQPFTSFLLFDDVKIQKKIAENFVERNFKNFKEKKLVKLKKTNSKIKIGYFSSDFRDHPTTHLIFDLLINHDKAKFEIYGFSFGPIENNLWTSKIKKHFTEFLDVRKKSELEIANLSRKKGINIALDLNGFTYFARTGIFAYRAAPIQINYLAYPGTMGAKFIDYIIADETVIPKKLKNNLSEKVLYLPNCYQPNVDNISISKQSRDKLNFGIPYNKFIFCNFNKIIKITPMIYNTWMNILKRTSNSILWILCDNKVAKENLLFETKRRGVDSNRIFFASKLPRDQHLQRLQICDIFLDTYPYSAHTLASDAIRVGLPIITLIGETFASRVCASILKQVNLEKFVCKKLEDYENLAIKLSKDTKLMANIKKNFKVSLENTPLFDNKKYTKDLEKLYIKLHKNK